MAAGKAPAANLGMAETTSEPSLGMLIWKAEAAPRKRARTAAKNFIFIYIDLTEIVE